jgi:hypothetical protein
MQVVGNAPETSALLTEMIASEPFSYHVATTPPGIHKNDAHGC